MPNHKIANATSSMLDMSPLKDLLGNTLTLRAKEERDIDDKTFHDDIVQRVMKVGWVVEVKTNAAPPPVAAQPSPAHEDSPAAQPSPAHEDPPPAHEEPPPAAAPEVPATPSVEPTPPAVPVETPVISEQPMTESPAPSPSKPGKKK